MNLLTRKRDFLRSLLPHVPAKLTKLFSFGCATLVAQNATSTRAELSPIFGDGLIGQAAANLA